MTRHTVFAGCVAASVALLVTAAVLNAQARAPQAVRPAPPMKGAPAGPLPPVPYEAFLARPVPMVQAAYEFAARHPEVLQYIPCYCGCETRGHGGNHDCFVKRRAADGRILEWDSHGSGCTICVDVARDAMLMFNSGASVTAIRAAIDQKWGQRYPSQTPTPRPSRTPAKSTRG
jgi:hypothetical protein